MKDQALFYSLILIQIFNHWIFAEIQLYTSQVLFCWDRVPNMNAVRSWRIKSLTILGVETQKHMITENAVIEFSISMMDLPWRLWRVTYSLGWRKDVERSWGKKKGWTILKEGNSNNSNQNYFKVLSYTIAGGNANMYSHSGIQFASSSENRGPMYFKIQLYHSSAYTRKMLRPIYHKDTFSTIFIAALFITARSWKQPRCPSREEWIKIM